VTAVVIVRIPLADVNAAVSPHFHDLVDQVVAHGDVCVQRLLEQAGLMLAAVFRSLRDQDDESGMDLDRRMLLQEIAPIQRDDDLVVGYRVRHQIPVLPARLADMGHVVRVVAPRLRGGDEVGAEAFVDQEAVHQCWGAGASTDLHSEP
jgi:hypothetical protein